MKKAGKISVVANSCDGKVAKASICLAKSNKIAKVDVCNNIAEITMENVHPGDKGQIRFNSVMDSNSPVVTEIIENGARKIRVDISSLPKGVYCVSYLYDGVVLDTRRISL